MIMKRNKLLALLIFLLLIIILINNKKDNNQFVNLNNDDKNLSDVKSLPQLIKPFYNTNHFIVADYIITPTDNDMTNEIQSALNDCALNGGGTVWLERGIYKVSSPIIVPKLCTLIGDWQDPDNYQGELDYGTKIVVDVNNFNIDSDDVELTGLFKMKASSGVEGITIYYQNQTLDNIVPQPWSFYCTAWPEDYTRPIEPDPSSLFTIKNVTIINGYIGIGRSTKEIIGHGMVMIENVKGIILKKGVQGHNSGEVFTITGLTLHPKYWANANTNAFNDSKENYSESQISTKIKEEKIKGKGLIFTDAELSEFVNISISGYDTGIYIPNINNVTNRSVGSGFFYNLNISDCKYGIYVDSGIKNGNTMISTLIGYTITNSSIEGSEYSIYTLSETVYGKSGTIKLNDVTLNGKVGGSGGLIYYSDINNSYIDVPKTNNTGVIISNSGKFSNLNIYKKMKNNGENFAYLEAGTSVDIINDTLVAISSKGGGVVYLKPGAYYITKTINIPSNVELRGSLSSPSYIAGEDRLDSNVIEDGKPIGTVLIIKSRVNAIKISGDNIGIYGIYFIYEDNAKSFRESISGYSEYPYTIEVQDSNNVYIKNVTINSATNGIFLNNSNDFNIQNVMTAILYNSFKINNSHNGLILNCLENGWLNYLNRLYDGKNEYSFNMASVKTLKHIILNNAKNIEVQNCFAYGSNTFLSADNSEIYAVNVGFDGSNETQNIFFNVNRTDGIIVNAFRSGGQLIQHNGGSFGIYNNSNMITYIGVTENDYLGDIFKISKKYIKPVLNVDDNFVIFDKISTKKIDYQYDGDGNLSCNTTNNELLQCSIDLNNKQIVITPHGNTETPVTINILASKGEKYLQNISSITVLVDTNLLSKGDLNDDKKVNTMDYILIRKHILGISILSIDKQSIADANNDDRISTLDYITIRKHIMRGSQDLLPGKEIPCEKYFRASSSKCYDATAPVINEWENTALKDTTITASFTTTTICNLGTDNGEGLETIEYYSDCTGTKTAKINNNCATITLPKCSNGVLYYQIKDKHNYSKQNQVDNIGLYTIFGQVYNKLLYRGQGISNNQNNLKYWVNRCFNVSNCVKEITLVANNNNDLSNEDFVKYLYESILGREQDSGVSGWINQLENGMTREEVINQFIESAETKNIYVSWGYK